MKPMFVVRVARAVTIASAFVAAATCSDQPPVAPRKLAPGQAALSLRPSFSATAAEGPRIPLSNLHATLQSPSGEKFDVDAPFIGDSAIVVFDAVPVSGMSAVFGLSMTAFDTQGAVAYSAKQDLTVRPGENPPAPTQPLVYSGADANVATVQISTPNPFVSALATTRLSASGKTSGGQDVPSLRIGWVSRDPSIATVDETGLVRGGASQGTTRIVATAANGVADSVTLKVRAPVDRVVLSVSNLSILRGNTSAVAVELRDATNHLIDDRTVNWTSSDQTIATVSPAGVVTARKIGKTILTAESEGKANSVAVSVATPIDHIELTPATLAFASISQTIPLVYKLVPKANGNVDGLKPNFTSATPTIVTVDSNGIVTAVSNGPSKLTAEIDSVTASVNAIVTQVAASTTISPSVLSISSLGAPSAFTVVFLDAKGKPIDNPKVEWSSSDPSIATVTGDGTTATVVGRRGGTATITATSDGKTSTATVYIAPIASQILVQTSATKFAAFTGVRLKASVADATGTVLYAATATYASSNPSIATVQGDSVFGVSTGTVRITATSGGLTGAIDLTVTPGVSGSDLIVHNDFNTFDDLNGARGGGANQQLFYRNLVEFSNTKARGSATGVMVYVGNGSLCAHDLACDAPHVTTLTSTLTSSGHAVSFRDSLPERSRRTSRPSS